MFFQLMFLGSFGPVIGTYLKDTLHFTGAEVGLTLTVYQLCSLASPLLAAFIVDRVISARLLYAALQVCLGFMAFFLGGVHEFVPFLLLFGLFALFVGPTYGLVNALSFSRMPDRRKNYGLVRLWGTVGWILTGLGMGLIWLIPGSNMNWFFFVTGCSSLAAATVTAILPHVPLEPQKGRFELIPRAAFRVLRQPSMIKFGILWFVSGILDRFYYIATAAYLTSLGFAASQIMPIMTLGQFTEAGLLLLTGPALRRLGLRNVLLLGLGMQLLRFVLFWSNLGPVFLLLALASHGFVFAFFFAVGTIFVDGHTEPDNRAGVHQLTSLIFFGSSSVVGALLTGFAFDWFATGGVVDYKLYYLLPIGLAVLNLILAPLFFRRSDPVPGQANP